MKVSILNLDPPIPLLEWEEVPPDTASFALFLVDSSNEEEPVYYWVLYNISSYLRRLEKWDSSSYTTLNSFQVPSYQPLNEIEKIGERKKLTLYFYALDNLYPVYDAYLYPPINALLDFCDEHSLELVTIAL